MFNKVNLPQSGYRGDTLAINVISLTNAKLFIHLHVTCSYYQGNEIARERRDSPHLYFLSIPPESYQVNKVTITSSNHFSLTETR